jgi:hypothetical protein
MSDNKSAVSDVTFQNILSLIETSTLSIRSVCKQIGVSHQGFYNYLKQNGESAREQYARSKNIQLENIADEMVDISDNGSNDFMTIVKGNESYEVENKEVVNRSRLRIDTRKWILSKLNPKKYGDKIEVDHKGLNIEISDIKQPT